MGLQTHVDIPKASFALHPTDTMLFVGSCFASEVGQRFADDHFRTVVNPYGTMYNPASVLHTVEKAIADGTIPSQGVDVAIFTLGTNHVYILNETGEIVDNCQKRPQRLFTERELTVSECAGYLDKAVELLRKLNPDTKVVLTVSPIRYRKYGYHESQLSKATLLLAIDSMKDVCYFPSYEIMNDELRDYRFYKPDMLHPSEQAVDYIYERFAEVYFNDDTRAFIKEWKPIREALNHRPFNPDSEQYRAFIAKARSDEQKFLEKWKL